MSKNHFLPFQINTIIFIFVIFFLEFFFGCSKLTFDGISGHFRSIRNFFFKTFLQNGRRRPFWMSEIHFWTHFWPFQIDMQLTFFLNFWQNDCRRSHFWPFQIDTEFYCFLAAILDIRKSLSIEFLAISDRSAILDVRNSPLALILDVRNSLLNAFLAISDRYATLIFWMGRQCQLSNSSDIFGWASIVMHVSSLKNVV